MSIKFNFKKYSSEDNTIYSVEIFRSYYSETLQKETWGYIDSMHPMNEKELLSLSKSIKELFIDNDRN